MRLENIGFYRKFGHRFELNHESNSESRVKLAILTMSNKSNLVNLARTESTCFEGDQSQTRAFSSLSHLIESKLWG